MVTRAGRSIPSNEVLVPLTVKSTPVWRMALPQVSPSMPTQAEEEWLLVLPEGSRGVGTVKVPVTVLKVPLPAIKTAPDLRTHSESRHRTRSLMSH